MHSHSLAFQITLIAQEASDRLADASILSSNLGRRSDSDYLLTLLAFELLLKAALLINERTPSKEHSYRQQFYALPRDAQQRLCETAAARMTTAADYSDLDTLLDTWSRNFVDLRYPYEKYKGMTEAEYHSRGEDWLDKGTPDAEADFVYHPEELFGLVFALQQEVDSWLNLWAQ